VETATPRSFFSSSHVLKSMDSLSTISNKIPSYEIERSSLGGRPEDGPLRWIYRLEPVAAAVALIVTFPLAVAIAVVIAILSGRSPLIRHKRVGRRGSPLPMLKFRTMWATDLPRQCLSLVEDVADAIPASKQFNDPRVVSKFAALCRRYSLDEIPQLYHVVRGQMSFVGPRPITREELHQYYGAHVAEVLSLRPGITGLWQVLGRSRLNYARRMRLDVILARRASPSLYSGYCCVPCRR
jgi:exopolysaccharide production protein ExoY